MFSSICCSMYEVPSTYIYIYFPICEGFVTGKLISSKPARFTLKWPDRKIKCDIFYNSVSVEMTDCSICSKICFSAKWKYGEQTIYVEIITC